MNIKQWLIIGGTALVSGTAGMLAGFLYAKKTLVEGYTEILNAEVEEMREHYRVRSTMKAYSSPREAAEELLPAELFDSVVQDLGQALIEDQKENVFDNKDTTEPNKVGPYIISVDVFMADDAGNRQVSVTYYEGDNVLADERDEPISQMEKFIGDGPIPFGRLSRDPNVIYIRNNEINVDFEITRSTGKYSEEVQGFMPEPTARQRINGQR